MANPKDSLGQKQEDKQNPKMGGERRTGANPPTEPHGGPNDRTEPNVHDPKDPKSQPQKPSSEAGDLGTTQDKDAERNRSSADQRSDGRVPTTPQRPDQSTAGLRPGPNVPNPDSPDNPNLAPGSAEDDAMKRELREAGPQEPPVLKESNVRVTTALSNSGQGVGTPPAIPNDPIPVTLPAGVEAPVSVRPTIITEDDSLVPEVGDKKTAQQVKDDPALKQVDDQ
jgi:hypothetical protein